MYWKITRFFYSVQLVETTKKRNNNILFLITQVNLKRKSKSSSK